MNKTAKRPMETFVPFNERRNYEIALQIGKATVLQTFEEIFGVIRLREPPHQVVTTPQMPKTRGRNVIPTKPKGS